MSGFQTVRIADAENERGWAMLRRRLGSGSRISSLGWSRSRKGSLGRSNVRTQTKSHPTTQSASRAPHLPPDIVRHSGRLINGERVR